MSTLVVFSCDQNYFPLAKGLVLSLLEKTLDRDGIGIAFIDIGCEAESLAWLRQHRVAIVSRSQLMAVPGIPSVEKYHLAQVCRPFLPRLFPTAEAFVWLDSDLWVQSAEAIKLFAHLANRNHDKLFICPEWHYAYTPLNSDIIKFQVTKVGPYYQVAYGQEIATKLAVRPTLNSGVFAMAAENPLWDMWASEVRSLYTRDYGGDTAPMRHMAEQLALNYLAFRAGNAVEVDPLLNFMCMWALPFRDDSGVVRVRLPPSSPIGIVHLSLWAARRALYAEHGLLYQRGEYLSDSERRALLSA